MKESIALTDEHGNTSQYGQGDIVVFLDETGQEYFRDKNYPIFGIGACVVPAEHYNQAIIKPWLDMKDMYFEGRDQPLHATDIRKPTKPQLQVLNEFFSKQQFGRIALVATDKSLIDNGFHIIDLFASWMYNKIAIFCSMKSQCRKVLLIFEDNERMNGVYAAYFDKYKISRNIHGEQEGIALEKGIMSKSEMEPGLEVADFIIHTAGTSVRDRLKGKRTSENERKDFEKVFKTKDKRLSHFMEITKVVKKQKL